MTKSTDKNTFNNSRRPPNSTQRNCNRSDDKSNKCCYNCKQPGHFARDCREPKKSQNTRVFKRKEKKQQKKAWCKEDESHRQALIKCAKEYFKAEQELLSIPGTSDVEDIQYATSLLYGQYKAETWPDQFKPKYDLSLAESPTKEALVAARVLFKYSDLTTTLHQELNYDFYWAVNETSKILSKVMGVSYDDDDLANYDLGECDDFTEVRQKKFAINSISKGSTPSR